MSEGNVTVATKRQNNTMAEGNGVQALSLLCVKSTLIYLKGVIAYYVHCDTSEKYASQLRNLIQSIPPNFHAEFLDKLAPHFDVITGSRPNQNVLDFIDELALILLSPSITRIDVDRFKFPTRSPEKYLKALELAKCLKVFVSQRENVWKYSVSKFKLLSSALIKMPLLRYLTLRHLRIPSCEISILLDALALNSPNLTYLDLKYSVITDSDVDANMVAKFGKNFRVADCVPALLKMKRLQHLNVSESWLSYCGIEAIVQKLPLERLDAIMDDSYDLQAVVIKRLLSRSQDPPISLARKSYSIAHEEQHVKDICKACPFLEHVIIQHCYGMNINMYFTALADLKHLKSITLRGLEWTLLGPHIPLEEEPQVISPLVTEITLQDPSHVDAHHLGVLSICFPQITHLWILGTQDGFGEDPWSRGPVFTKLTHLHYQGSLAGRELERIEREQGLFNVLDILLGWCHQLRCLTLYTDELNESMLYYATRWNGLHHLEELRIGLQHNLSTDIIMFLLKRTTSLKILGRTDWWHAMNIESRYTVVALQKMRFRNLEVFGFDDASDINQDPCPNHFHQRNYIW